jgi:hypothetical protein
MLKINKIYLLSVFLLLFTGLFAQKSKTDTLKLIQFTGVVLEADSLNPLPFTHITIKHSHIGTITDYYGFFSFVAKENDTIVFSNISYKRAEFIIPDSLPDNRYSVIQLMQKDTFLLKETVIYPWPTREQFKEAFLHADIPDDDLERAKKNLSKEDLIEYAENIEGDPGTSYKYVMNQQYTRMYYAGQYPSISLLNPVAWAKFIQAWKNGDFKRKEKRNSYDE